MAVTEESRHHLHQTLDAVIGTTQAVTLMELLPPVGWADVATKRDLGHQDELMVLRFEGIERRFEGIERRFEGIDRRFEEFERRFDEIDRRFEEIERRFEEIDRRFEAVDQRFDAIDRRFDALEQRMDRLEGQYRQFQVALLGTWITTLLAILLTRL